MKKILIGLCFALTLAAAPAGAQESRTFTDDSGTEVTVPANPQRIISLHDTSLTVALLELGIVPVGSHGRTTVDGAPYIRSGKLVSGYDFDNSSIEFVGNLPADVEKIAALEPDLILTTSWQSADVAQLRAIAPTYVFDFEQSNDFAVYDKLAELTGTTDRLDKFKTRYRTHIDLIKQLTELKKIRVNVIQGHKGELHVWNTYGSLGKVLRDAGFAFPAIVDAIKGSERGIFSGESYPDLDADFIFVTYRPDLGDTPATARAALDDVLPNWCQVLHACAHGQIIYLPREIASSATYDSLIVLAQMVASHIAGRDFTPKPD